VNLKSGLRSHGISSLTLLAFVLYVTTVRAQVNSWTNPLSANWEETNSWSLGALPSASQSIFITNSGYKGVGIFPNVPGQFADSLTVSNLTVSAPANALSTLILNYFGTNVPLRVLQNCEIGTNGTIAVFYSRMEVSGTGVPLSIHGSLVQDGGQLLVTNGATVLFGGSFSMGGDSLFQSLYVQGGSCNQTGGVTIATNLLLDSGSAYNLTNGIVGPSAWLGISGDSIFSQYGGTNQAGVRAGDWLSGSPGHGSYRLYGGTIEGDIGVAAATASSGDFLQTAGLIQANSVCLGCGNLGAGNYSFQGGRLFAGNLDVSEGTFSQSGGSVCVTNFLSVHGFFDDYAPPRFSHYSLGSGFLSCGSLSVSLFGSFDQSSGTHLVSSDLYCSLTSYSLSGGTLSTSNTSVWPGYISDDPAFVDGQLLQSGGLHTVTNRLSIAGSYILSGGTLVAKDIFNSRLLVISNNPALFNSGIFDCSGTVFVQNATIQLGRLRLSGNSELDFGSGNATLRFSPSSLETWSPAAVLFVTNWAGSTNGGVNTKLFFGNNPGGISPAQLRQLRFVNPAGFLPGNYFGILLPTGEIVPTIRPILFISANGRNVIFNWSGAFVLQRATNVLGPYVDLSAATSPYTNNALQLPQAFFRLHQ
jgi:hypothetical protein